jgi:hypothetical protein
VGVGGYSLALPSVIERKDLVLARGQAALSRVVKRNARDLEWARVRGRRDGRRGRVVNSVFEHPRWFERTLVPSACKLSLSTNQNVDVEAQAGLRSRTLWRSSK